MMMHVLLRGAVLAAGAMLAGAPAVAQAEFPSRPISLVVPYAPGGTTDILARLVAKPMGEFLGQPVVVENTSGAGGTIGTQRVVKAAPDGYTLTFGNMGSLAANAPLYPSAGFDPVRDLAPVGLVATVPMVLAVSNGSGVQTLQSLIDAMKNKPGAFNFGSGGPGTTNHLAAAMFLHLSGTKAEIIQYRGAGPAITDLMAGQVQGVIDQTLTMVPLHSDKRARALAVSGPARIDSAKDVPTFAEAGLPSFDLTVWNAIAAPRGTPGPVIEKLAQALSRALDTPEVADRLAQFSATAPAGAQRGPQALGELIENDARRLAKLIQAAGIQTN
ncbi:tripartite tricarboxylate transporter substrate binding protein [Orrella sp. JC864]|uniref:Bug family tripartite tricarboxylate transporter substrate binding protein n=1 Tax=Orrella sp. JC864 TaxID=3120298 RepID=UPI0030096EE1